MDKIKKSLGLKETIRFILFLVPTILIIYFYKLMVSIIIFSTFVLEFLALYIIYTACIDNILDFIWRKYVR